MIHTGLRSREAIGVEMRFWLTLLCTLLSLTSANGQCVEMHPPDGGPSVRFCLDTSRPPECDDRGCYFDELNRWRNPSTSQTDFQRRTTEEYLKKLREERR